MKLDLIPRFIVAAASLMLIWVSHSYLDLRDEYTAYKAAVQQSRENALNAARAREEAHRQNLAAVKEEYEKRLSEIGDIALRNYRRMRDDAATRERVALSLAPAGVEVDAGAAAQCNRRVHDPTEPHHEARLRWRWISQSPHPVE